MDIIYIWEKLPEIKILSILLTIIYTVPPTFQTIGCFSNMIVLNMLSTRCSVFFSKTLLLCVDLEWCNPFQRILGLHWGWQSVLLVCDGQRWGSQGRSGSSCQTHKLQLRSAARCWSFRFTATLGLVFQATLLQGNYPRLVRQQQIRWARPWWCRQMTGRCWCPGRLPVYRGHSGSRMLWS